MIIHNDLPKSAQWLYDRIVSSIHCPQEGRYGVTTLPDCPCVNSLKIANWGVIELKASDFLWSTMGHIGHLALQKEKEPKLELGIDGVTVVGKIDFPPTPEYIRDIKWTSVYSFLLGLKDDWIAQLNLYDLLDCKCTPDVQEYYPDRKLEIHAFLRDWRRGEAFKPDYPRIPFDVVSVPHWTQEQQLEYLHERIADHVNNPMRPCTDVERWRRESAFAVMKKGRKTALAVKGLDTHAKAEAWIKENKPTDKSLYIDERKGECIRCKGYCDVRFVCPFNTEKPL